MTNSYAPVFDPDGKYMYFLSDRDFNEVLGNVDFEFANPKTTRIYVVTLRADEPSPFQPLSDETQIKKEENKDELLTPPGKEQGKTGGKTGARPRPGAKRRTRKNIGSEGKKIKIKTRAIKTKKRTRINSRNSALTLQASRAAWWPCPSSLLSSVPI
jgi:hypothetical protein